MDFSEEQISRAEAILGYEFKDPELLAKALTHPSAVEGHAVESSYERLEFLGDALLGAYVSLRLYEANPAMDEGDLTKAKTSLVSGGKLSSVADGLGIGDCIVFGESELGTERRGLRSALENVYEALVGALYLDGGSGPCQRFVERTLLSAEPVGGRYRDVAAKSQLQEFTQSKLHCAPVYRIVSTQGPPHAPVFTTEVSVDGRVVGSGEGSSKKGSETAAAQMALETLLAEFAGEAG